MKPATGIDFLKQCKPDENIHIVRLDEEARKRKENPGPHPKTRFQIELDDPELYSKWNVEKERIVKRCGNNKSIATDLMYRAWTMLTDAMIDRILASEEGPPDGG